MTVIHLINVTVIFPIFESNRGLLARAVNPQWGWAAGSENAFVLKPMSGAIAFANYMTFTYSIIQRGIESLGINLLTIKLLPYSA